MTQQLYSVEQVADLLGLHVKTVRAYVRDGRLKAVRIGKQYRIAREDLEAFTGSPAPRLPGESARRHRHVEVSSIVQVDAIDFEAMSRLSMTLTSLTMGPPRDGERLHIQTVYDEERASMKIIMTGGLADTAELLKVISTLTEGR